MMMPPDPRSEAESAILSVLPQRAKNLARLRAVAEKGRWPVVAAIGKYNHGKSRLLNELIGQVAFSVADKRETVALSERNHGGVCWLDSPGLDADVGTVDDDRAWQAIWIESDVRLFVHAAKEGELDARELALLASLRSDDHRSGRQTLFVLSQVDQLADDQYGKVVQAIGSQVLQMEVHPVSSTRYRQGTEGAKKLMLERSGIPALQSALQQAVAHVPKARDHETASLLGDIRAELRRLCTARQALLADLLQQQVEQRQRFDRDLAAVLSKVAQNIRAVLDVPGPDHSLSPDSFANQFKITPGKLARNRLQVAYSKACIEINGVLIGHGAFELPLAQQTMVRSLDNTMVAVMGVHVKYRKELTEIFCEDAGRERLRREFARYFELSSDRTACALGVAQAKTHTHLAEQALVAVDGLADLMAPP